MSKPVAHNFSFLNEYHASSHSGLADHSSALLDDEIGNSSGLNFNQSLFDIPDGFGASGSDFNSPFRGAGRDVVLYSSDLDISPGHGAPAVFMAAGGSFHGGATSSGGSALVAGAASTGLTINVSWDASVSKAPAGFKDAVLQAVQYYETHFSDPVTLNIAVGYGEAGGYSLGGALGMSLTYLQSSNYTQIKNALIADQSGATDASAVASLGSDPTNGGNFWVPTAEAKALGLNTSTTSLDGYVGFSSTAGIFDYNNTDGIAQNQYDFNAVVAHEISEVMGRILLVGGTIGSTSNSFDPLDLFHYSASGVHDLSGSVPGYFSVNNGATSLNTFNTVSGGDPGDWKGDTIDAFNAYGAPSVVAPISAADLTALDAIGWNAATSSGPPPPPPSQPDLVVSVQSLHDTTLNLQFSNNGAGVAAASTAGLYLSTDGTITTADTLIGTIAIPSLAAGASISGAVIVPFPSNLAAGTYHLGVIADYNGQIAESNESNNAAMASTSIILGNSSRNTLTGTAGAEEIVGLGNNDTLIGNGGADVLIGGSGSDHFRYNAVSDGGGPGDTVADFSPGSDVLDFAHSAFGFSSTGTLSSASFIANATGPTTSAQKFWYNTANFTLYYDADGSGAGAAVAMAQLENHATLNSSNIHLV